MTSILAPLSTLSASLLGRANVARTSAALQQAQEEVSTGLKADVYADLGQTAAIPLALRAQMARTEGFVTSNALLGNRMDVMATSLTTVHDSAQSVLAQAVANLTQPGADSATLQQAAQAALDQVTTALNATYAGSYLFSGTASDQAPLQAQETANPATGFSPDDVVTGIVGAGPTDAASAAVMAQQLDAIFGSATGTGQDFEATFYNGTPATDASGTPGARVTGQISETKTISYGVQANDPAIRSLFKGLTMLAATDPSKITDTGAYQSWMQSAVSALSDGVDGVTSAQATLGSQQALVSDTATRQGDLKTVYTSRIASFEAVDPYEAASRLTALQTQLQATYAATATIGKLSILDYL
ncbi:flagellin N-terminal helical domain-containing protein [Acidimangrovimonas sediminis]|uniref:flagellin N-terminal helical domain-containing protein n=1 Tax=Acidimangrovimonas sediminis TaxID=2056283 RepID=UPI000C7F89DE|nr:flagellin [Acidimangrovimonas sediminis]